MVSNAKFRVFRSFNAGADWTPMKKGLPQENAYLYCMRGGMATDPFESCGVYTSAPRRAISSTAETTATVRSF